MIHNMGCVMLSCRACVTLAKGSFVTAVHGLCGAVPVGTYLECEQMEARDSRSAPESGRSQPRRRGLLLHALFGR